MDLLTHIASVIVPLLGATWYLGTAIAKLQATIEPLKELPERVARVETRLDLTTPRHAR